MKQIEINGILFNLVPQYQRYDSNEYQYRLAKKRAGQHVSLKPQLMGYLLLPVEVPQVEGDE